MVLHIEPLAQPLQPALQPRLHRLDRDALVCGDLRRSAIVVEAPVERRPIRLVERGERGRDALDQFGARGDGRGVGGARLDALVAGGHALARGAAHLVAA